MRSTTTRSRRSRSTRARLITEAGDDTPIAWVNRDQRFVEKLATPDVTIADIIGDVDPIKAARGGHILADELTIHYGMLPRANRGIFALNELPDLAGKVQVGLFNIMQEGDVQIKGYPVRLPLDVLLCFTANPEDYTARGKIITPLKDRIGSEITTHYPETVELGMAITAQEAWTVARDAAGARAATSSPRSIERVAFEARTDKRIDSGPACRSACRSACSRVSCRTRSAARSRLGEREIVPRIADVYAALPSITGKMELEYEGELVGAPSIAKELIRRAADATFQERAAAINTDEIVMWFESGGALQVTDEVETATMYRAFGTVPGLHEAGRRERARDRPMTRRSPLPRASWCSSRWWRDARSRAPMVAVTGAGLTSISDGARIRTSSAAASRRDTACPASRGASGAGRRPRCGSRHAYCLARILTSQSGLPTFAA